MAEGVLAVDVEGLTLTFSSPLLPALTITNGRDDSCVVTIMGILTSK